MALSHWTDKKNGEYMTLSSYKVHEGAKSLRITRKQNDEVVKTLNQSETDTPKHVNLTFWLYLTYSATYGEFGVFFRYQDNDNYYVAYLIQMANQTQFRLGKKETGSLSWSDATLIGNYLNTWIHLKLMLCDAGGTIHALLYKKEGENWDPKATKTLSPAKWPNGGALGVGVRDKCGAANQQHIYLDDTKIYY